MKRREFLATSVGIAGALVPAIGRAQTRPCPPSPLSVSGGTTATSSCNPADAEGEAIQHLVFEVGKRHPFESLRGWFQALYETLLGSSQGPRMGSFIALYGVDNSRKLIAEALESVAA